MKIIIALNHPAHYYLFKFISRGLVENQHDVRFVIREKDILEKLLISENVSYIKLSEKKKRSTNKLLILFKIIKEFIKQDISLLHFVVKFKPDIMLGTDIAITHIGFLRRIPSIIVNEDDIGIMKLFAIAAYPFVTKIVSPIKCNVGIYQYKKVAYNGIQKMAYLNPKYFTPDKSVINEIGIKENSRYFIIRLVSLTAGHDIESKHCGIDRGILNRIINKLSPYGRIFISSEKDLDKDLEKYRINLPPNKMHDLLAFADLFIGDSQTMSAEAGILGTPFIRFNDFVGKIEVLNELENIYQLGFGIRTVDVERLFAIIDDILKIENIKLIWKEKTFRLFKEKIDLTSFMLWYIQDYPQSAEIIKKDPNYQYKFR